MTMPHLMNCSHDDKGWCLSCVKELYDSKNKRNFEQETIELSTKVYNELVRKAEAYDSGQLAFGIKIEDNGYGRSILLSEAYPNRIKVEGVGTKVVPVKIIEIK